jgi:hypothetical protein
VSCRTNTGLPHLPALAPPVGGQDGGVRDLRAVHQPGHGLDVGRVVQLLRQRPARVAVDGIGERTRQQLRATSPRSQAPKWVCPKVGSNVIMAAS